MVSLAPAQRIFTGTQSEWDSLSTAIKKTYGIVNITDDESGTPEYYSTEEVKTNKVWIDGKPIYRNVYDIDLTFSAEGWKDSGKIIADIDKIIDSRCYGYDSSYNTQYIKFPCAGVGKSSDKLMVWGYNHGRYTQICIEYTKTTD